MGNLYSKQFMNLCRRGKFTKAKEFYQNNADKIDIHANNEEAFRLSCKYGHLEIAKWLINLSIKEEEPINIHIDNEWAFRKSCEQGHLNVVKWLYRVSKQQKTPIDLTIFDSYINIHKTIVDNDFELCTLGVRDDTPFIRCYEWLVYLGVNISVCAKIRRRAKIWFEWRIPEWETINSYYITPQKHIKDYYKTYNKNNDSNPSKKHKLSHIWKHYSSVDI